MKTLLLICSALFVHSGLLAEIKPEGSDAVFSIYASGRGGGSGTKLYMEGDRPLMVISAVADVRVSSDRKMVRLTMTPADARKFVGVTRQHPNELIILVGRGRALQAVQVGAPVTDGVLEFRYPQEALAADYLKKRFGLR